MDHDDPLLGASHSHEYTAHPIPLVEDGKSVVRFLAGNQALLWRCIMVAISGSNYCQMRICISSYM